MRQCRDIHHQRQRGVL